MKSKPLSTDSCLPLFLSQLECCWSKEQHCLTEKLPVKHMADVISNYVTNPSEFTIICLNWYMENRLSLKDLMCPCLSIFLVEIACLNPFSFSYHVKPYQNLGVVLCFAVPSNLMIHDYVPLPFKIRFGFSFNIKLFKILFSRKSWKVEDPLVSIYMYSEGKI